MPVADESTYKGEMELPKIRAVPLEQQRQTPPARLEGEQEMKNLNLKFRLLCRDILSRNKKTLVTEQDMKSKQGFVFTCFV